MEQKDFSTKINPFLYLSGNSEVMRLVKQINLTSLALDEKIKSLQAECQHEKMIKIREYPQKVFDEDKGAVIAKECTNCGFTLKKPQGSSEKVCQVCWGEMEYLGREPGQGGGIHHYECKMCRHHHTST